MEMFPLRNAWYKPLNPVNKITIEVLEFLKLKNKKIIGTVAKKYL